MFEIKLYGEVIPFQDAWISQKSGYINLTILQNQLEKANGKDVKIRINSVGGDVDEGFAIYSELRRYAKDNNAKITTLAEGRCASIATVIFLAGDQRIVTEYTEPFVHNAWSYTMGDAKQIIRVAADLEKCNEKIAKHYQQHTNLTYKQARQLMDNQTSISPDQAIEFRFATKIEEVFRPVAKQRIINKLKIEMNKKNQKRRTGFKAKMQALKSLLGFQNKIVFDAENREIDFYELEDHDTVQTGDKANIDGKPADGEVVIASGETYVFESGELIEIKEAGANNSELEEKTIEELEEKVQELENENEELKEEVETLEEEKEELEQLLNKATVTISNMKRNLQSAQSKTINNRKEVRRKEKSNTSKWTGAINNLKNRNNGLYK